MVHRTIARLAFPGGKPRPKPGPYRGDDTAPTPASVNGNGAHRNGRAPTGASGSGPEQPTAGVRVDMPEEG